ncbi:MAG: hypothetical protein JWO94_3128 [Verrucomicrobiaceae bacterium]|nr:hypothetical protein [Verrucomicrobiaceae bacterium]
MLTPGHRREWAFASAGTLDVCRAMKASPAELDLFQDKAWHGLQPGMTRPDVLAVITAAGLKYTDNEGDPSWLVVEDSWGMELRFEKDGAQRLRQIARDDGDLTWRGEPVLGSLLHEAWEIMKGETEDAGWSPQDATDEPMDGSPPSKPGPYPDELLLYEGTLWLPKRALGLVMCDGMVIEMVWRRREDLPSKLEGPVTAAQLVLSANPDLSQILRKQMRPAASSLVKAAGWTQMQWLIALMSLVAMTTVGKLGFDETRRWQQAVVLEGRLTALDALPGKAGARAYHVRYADPEGKRGDVVLEQADFYVAPREIGEAVQVVYVSGDPPRVKGPARARDAAFLRYVPWAVGILLFHVVAMTLAGWLGQRSPSAGIEVGELPVTGNPPGDGPDGSPPGGPQVKIV